MAQSDITKPTLPTRYKSFGILEVPTRILFDNDTHSFSVLEQGSEDGTRLGDLSLDYIQRLLIEYGLQAGTVLDFTACKEQRPAFGEALGKRHDELVSASVPDGSRATGCEGA